MTATLKYLPDTGIELNSKTINWRTNRDLVRNQIDLPFKEMDNQTIESKRDVYKNVNGGDNYFFLNYDIDSVLTEVEVHWGVDVFVNEVQLNFNKHIKDNISALSKLTNNYREIEPGNYLFPDLKLTISDAESCGGDGHELRYFYASTDVTHLDE